jgi:hypothetical protein
MALRVRRLEDVPVPASMLHKGVNVLAIELHRVSYHEAAASRDRQGKLRLDGQSAWSTVGLIDLHLTAASGRGLTPNVDRPKGLQLWNADVLTWVFDLDHGDPAEPVAPLTLVGARNGAFSGQVVVGSDQPIQGLRTQVSDLIRPTGAARIPAAAVRIRYARPTDADRGAAGHYPGLRQVSRFDALAELPPRTVPVRTKPRRRGVHMPAFGAVQPIWVTVNVPSDTAPGEYGGRLTITTTGAEPRHVPIQLRVCRWVLPRPRDFVGHVGLIQSPDSVALQYGVALWSDAHFERIGRSFSLLGQVGNKTLYLPLISRTNFGNEQSMVRWVRATDGRYKRDYGLIDRYLDLYEKHAGPPQVVCLYVWDPFTGGHPRWSTKRIEPRGAPVTVLDPNTGAVETMDAPVYGTPESEAFWRPVLKEVRARLLKRGVRQDGVMIGIAGDQLPTREAVAFFQKIAPRMKWVLHSHSLFRSLYKTAPVGYVAHVWNTAFAPDPTRKRFYGWNRPLLVTTFPRHGIGVIHPPLYPHSPLGVHRMIVEGAFLGNLHGFGRVGADFWPVIKGKRGRPATVSARYPISDLGHVNLTLATASILAPGPDGAVATARFENLREGLQEAQARVFIEKALLSRDLRGRLGDDLAESCQELLDERTRLYRIACRTNWQWYAASGWQERSAGLYTAAARVAEALGGGTGGATAIP